MGTGSVYATEGENHLPAEGSDCSGLPDHAELKKVLTDVTNTDNGGLGFHMWGTLVNRDGYVCAVAFSGPDRDNQWPGSRIISAQKAHTANAFSQPPDGKGGSVGGIFKGLSLSTANLWTQVQPAGGGQTAQGGGSLYGLQHSNPVDGGTAYSGDPTRAGQEDDPLVGEKIGGVNVFGGGVALYNEETILGALGVSGDTSCADHTISWKMRDAFSLDHIPNGVLPRQVGGDNIIHDLDPVFGKSASGFGHPICLPPSPTDVLLPVTHPLGTPAGGSSSDADVDMDSNGAGNDPRLAEAIRARMAELGGPTGPNELAGPQR